jgi:aspartyl/asparaginyl beta-hydroxylase (cupin superfamily)
VLLQLCEKLICLVDSESDVAFFDSNQFPWVNTIETHWKTILTELETVLEQRTHIPNFQDLSEDQRILTEGEDWKTFFLYAYGHEVEENCGRCPETTKLLKAIPEMTSAMFSILAPGKHIPEHRGPYKGLLRYHLGLVIPSEGSCRIRVKEEVRSWGTGQSLIFDDSHPHEAWNDSSFLRVILFVDILRPLPFPLSVINRLMVNRFSSRPFITDIVDSARKNSLPNK